MDPPYTDGVDGVSAGRPALGPQSGRLDQVDRGAMAAPY